MARSIPVLIALVVAAATPLPAVAEPLFALQSGAAGGDTLLRFDSASPGTVSAVAVNGLASGDFLVGIDVRPATGQLYGLGTLEQLYRLDPTTGQATPVGSGGGFGLTGQFFGFDFNPTADQIRVTADTGDNLRVDPDTGNLISSDGLLSYAAGDTHAGQLPQVVGSAFSNNFAGAPATTLYGLDSHFGSLAIQNPKNAGTLHTVGSLGVLPLTDFVGFDISGLTSTAYAAFTAGNGVTGLYTVDLGTGAASLIGAIGSGGLDIEGLAASVPIAALPEPAPAALLLAALSALLALRGRRTRQSV